MNVKEKTMKQIKEVFNHQLSILVNQSKSAAYFQYVARVQCCYKDVIQHIFKQSSALILDHTNNVIVKKEHGAIIGTIFVDESIYAAELNAHREIIALLFSELRNLTLDQVRISVSRGTYKNKHPFTETSQTTSTTKRSADFYNREKDMLTTEEYNTCLVQISKIDDKRLQIALKDAILQWVR